MTIKSKNDHQNRNESQKSKLQSKFSMTVKSKVQSVVKIIVRSQITVKSQMSITSHNNSQM